MQRKCATSWRKLGCMHQLHASSCCMVSILITLHGTNILKPCLVCFQRSQQLEDKSVFLNSPFKLVTCSCGLGMHWGPLLCQLIKGAEEFSLISSHVLLFQGQIEATFFLKGKKKRERGNNLERPWFFSTLSLFCLKRWWLWVFWNSMASMSVRKHSDAVVAMLWQRRRGRPPVWKDKRKQG